MTTCKNALTAYLIVLICAVASFGQAPPEIKAKLDAKIKQLASLSTDPEIVNAVKTHNATPASDQPVLRPGGAPSATPLPLVLC